VFALSVVAFAIGVVVGIGGALMVAALNGQMQPTGSRVTLMTRSERAQAYMNILTEEGYRPSLDEDGDVVFKKEGRSYLILIDENDPRFFRLVFPNFWPIESELERARVVQAASATTGKIKVAKVFVVRDDVWATVELFVETPDSAKAVFERSMSVLTEAVDTFAEQMRGGSTPTTSPIAREKDD